MNLASNIKRYISEAGIKQSVLAQKSSITENALTLSLNGKRRLAADEYVRLCRALGVGLDFFTAGE